MDTIHFYDNSQEALRDQQLHLALERATVRFRTHRDSAFARLPEGEALRDRTRTRRLEALAQLDTLLLQLEERAVAAGAQVHWARDGRSAVDYIIRLAADRGVRTIAKSKSMATEEIGLNEALEGQGLHVVETDLGEYIIQLAGEKPSHIIAPAVHKTRGQVSELFAERLGSEPTDSIPDLVDTARRALRETFLGADMGICGVNCAVAETGTLILVTNEGNGRLVTSLPRVVVAVMGIERIVETLDDAASLLHVLARSASGQQLSVYTTFNTGAARPGEPDGPEELHLILLDNGRSRILGGEYAEALACIRCGACLNVCPVYREVGGHAYGAVYSGPIGAVLTPLLTSLEAAHSLPQASSLCGACREACPVRIDLPRMLLRLRHDATRRRLGPWWETLGIRLWAWACVSPWRYRVAGRLAALATAALARDGWIRRLPGPLGRWTRSRDFPAFARRSFTRGEGRGARGKH